MRFYKLPVEIAKRRDLPAGAKVVFAVVADRIGHNSCSWPGVRTIAKDAGMSVSGVLKAVRQLEGGNALQVERRGSGKANRYRLPVQTVTQSAAPHKVQRSTKCNSGALQSGTEALHKVEPNQTDALNQTNISRPNSHEFRLSQLLLDLILERKPDFKKPNLQRWAVHIDRMVRLDGREPARVEAVIRWCQQDPFWQSNILSTAKLREKFDQLELKMKGSQYGSGKIGEHAATAEPFVR